MAVPGRGRARLRYFAVTLAASRHRKRITLAFKRHVITFRRINGIWSIFNFLQHTRTRTRIQQASADTSARDSLVDTAAAHSRQ